MEKSKQIDDKKKQMNQKLQSQLGWQVFDYIFPAGKLSKLCKVTDYESPDLKINDILTKFTLDDAYPVTMLVGATKADRGNFSAGIARACQRVDSIIIDSGVETGIEKFAIRRNVNILGIAPEDVIAYPKINPTSVENYTLCNGHNHLILLKSPGKTLKWGDEVDFKFEVAKTIAKDYKYYNAPCKIVVVLFGDYGNCQRDIELAVENGYPIIVVKGSKLCEDIISALTEENYQVKNQFLSDLIKKGQFYALDNYNSEEIAAFLHFFLTVTPKPFTKK